MFPLINKRETGVNLRRIMDVRGITPKDVQEYLGLGCVQSVYRWTDGINMPTIDNLYALSELFQVPIDDIICGTRTWRRQGFKISNFTPQFARLYLYYLNIKRSA